MYITVYVIGCIDVLTIFTQDVTKTRSYAYISFCYKVYRFTLEDKAVVIFTIILPNIPTHLLEINIRNLSKSLSFNVCQVQPCRLPLTPFSPMSPNVSLCKKFLGGNCKCVGCSSFTAHTSAIPTNQDRFSSRLSSQ